MYAITPPGLDQITSGTLLEELKAIHLKSLSHGGMDDAMLLVSNRIKQALPPTLERSGVRSEFVRAQLIAPFAQYLMAEGSAQEVAQFVELLPRTMAAHFPTMLAAVEEILPRSARFIQESEGLQAAKTHAQKALAGLVQTSQNLQRDKDLLKRVGALVDAFGATVELPAYLPPSRPQSRKGRSSPGPTTA